MPSDARPPSVRRARPHGRTATTSASPVGRSGLTLSSRTAVEASRGAVEDTIHDLVMWYAGAAGDSPVAAPAVPEPDRWADEGGPLGRLYAGIHPLSAAEREAWEGHAYARERMLGAVVQYARALHRSGQGRVALLACVHATVVHTGGRLQPAVLATVFEEARRECVALLEAS